MTTFNIGNTFVKDQGSMLIFGKEHVEGYDEDFNQSRHLVTEVIFFIKSPHHALSFQDLLGKKIRLGMMEKCKTRKIDFESKSEIKVENEYVVKLRLAKSIKSMQSLHQLLNKWKITNKWILSHCLSYSLNISSTNKKFRRLSNFTEPYLDGFFFPNVPNTQLVDWLPAILQSDDALYAVTPSWQDTDDVDNESAACSSSKGCAFPGGIEIPLPKTRLSSTSGDTAGDDAEMLKMRKKGLIL